MIKIDYRKVVKYTLLMTSILIIGLSTLSGSFNANARQQEIKNQGIYNTPESILNVTFNDNVYLDNIIDNELNPEKNWQGLTFDSNTYGITSISGISNIGGMDEMVSINGKLSSKTVKKEYNNKLQELITRIDDIKNNGSKLDNPELSDEDKSKVTKELSKMKGWEVKKQRYWNWSQSKIFSISVVGNTNTLATLKTILEKSGHCKNIDLITFNEIKKISDELINKLENKTDDEQQSIIDEMLNIEFSKVGIKSDIDNNIDEKLSAFEDNLIEPIQLLVEPSESESLETSLQKVFKSNLKGITANAGGCEKVVNKTYNAWHSKTWRVNSCFVNEMGVWLAIGGLALGLAAVLGCSAVCGSLAGFIGVWFGIIQAIDKKCGDQGVDLRIRYGVPLVSKIC